MQFMQRLRLWKNSSPVAGSGLAVPLLAAMLLSGPMGVTRAAPATHLAEKGEALFQQKCAACHTIGKGKLVGPDLQGVGQRVSRDWLERFIAAPSEMYAAKDPIAAALGKELFTGAVRLQNGGSECMACHTVAGVGYLGGGILGPDLTQVYQRFGQTGLASVLGTLPFPTMQGGFQDKPLTQSEQADLLAFFAQENQKKVAPTASTGKFVGVGLGGFIVLTGASHLLWRKRLKGVRKRLVGGGK